MSNSPLSVLGESTRLVSANTAAVFEIVINNASLLPEDISVNVISPSKRVVPAKILPGTRSGVQSVEFVPTEVGTHIVEVSIEGEKLPSPLVAKVYDAGLIQVADVGSGVVGQPVQFRGKCIAMSAGRFLSIIITYNENHSVTLWCFSYLDDLHRSVRFIIYTLIFILVPSVCYSLYLFYYFF